MTKFFDWLAQRKKAIAGFVSPAIAIAAGIWLNTGSLPTAHEWAAIGLTCVLTALGVHVAPSNKPTKK